MTPEQLDAAEYQEIHHESDCDCDACEDARDPSLTCDRCGDSPVQTHDGICWNCDQELRTAKERGSILITNPHPFLDVEVKSAKEMTDAELMQKIRDMRESSARHLVEMEDDPELANDPPSQCYWSETFQRYVPILDPDTDNRGDAADSVHDRERPAFSIRLAARAAAVVTAAALSLVCLLPASAHTGERLREYPIIGSAAYDAGCLITEEYEDGNAYAWCPEDGANYVFDADGNRYANAAHAPIRPPMQWWPMDETHN